MYGLTSLEARRFGIDMSPELLTVFRAYSPTPSSPACGSDASSYRQLGTIASCVRDGI